MCRTGAELNGGERKLSLIHISRSAIEGILKANPDNVVIVDIVETGTTLRENGLRVVTEFMPISARFIANKASYQFKHNEMDAMLEALRKTLQEETK